jgi:1,4-dihydroxy-2-naphthoate octaprenyltransferase
MKEKIGIWMAQVRAPFLLLAVALVLVGGAVAHDDGHFAALPFVLCLVGTVLAHASVNLFNELSDYRTGIDSRTRRTPFSGGSGNLQAGLTTESGVKWAAWGTLSAASAIGLYLVVQSGWVLLIFMIAGGLVTICYTDYLAKIALGELFAGLCLGSMVVAGTYLAITGALTATVLMVSVPPGILTSLLLFLNEFPDLEADSSGGRRHLVILLGKRISARIYATALAVCYGFLIWGVASGRFPGLILITLLTVPLALKAAVTVLKQYDSFEKMVSAQGANVGVVLGVDFLMAAAFFLH